MTIPSVGSFIQGSVNINPGSVFGIGGLIYNTMYVEGSVNGYSQLFEQFGTAGADQSALPDAVADHRRYLDRDDRSAGHRVGPVPERLSHGPPGRDPLSGSDPPEGSSTRGTPRPAAPEPTLRRRRPPLACVNW